MASITQDMRYRLFLIKYAEKYGVTKAAIKFVPSVCLVNEARGQKFYQYTAIDEYSRWRSAPSHPDTTEKWNVATGRITGLFMQSFRSVTGTTPTQYIIRQRLENVRDLLLDTDLPIAQIAEICGFTDPFYFSGCFKKGFAMSPIQYRETMR